MVSHSYYQLILRNSFYWNFVCTITKKDKFLYSDGLVILNHNTECKDQPKGSMWNSKYYFLMFVRIFNTSAQIYAYLTDQYDCSLGYKILMQLFAYVYGFSSILRALWRKMLYLIYLWILIRYIVHHIIGT